MDSICNEDHDIRRVTFRIRLICQCVAGTLRTRSCNMCSFLLMRTTASRRQRNASRSSMCDCMSSTSEPCFLDCPLTTCRAMGLLFSPQLKFCPFLFCSQLSFEDPQMDKLYRDTDEAMFEVLQRLPSVSFPALIIRCHCPMPFLVYRTTSTSISKLKNPIVFHSV